VNNFCFQNRIKRTIFAKKQVNISNAEYVVRFLMLNVAVMQIFE